jgi:uncharacterized protein
VEERNEIVEERNTMETDEKTRVELEAAVYRRLVEHLRKRADVQNIDLMILAGFCRNCLSDWMREAADAKGVAMTKEKSREIVYGVPYDEWRKNHQREATPEQLAAFEKSQKEHPAG